MVKDFISLADFTADELMHFLNLADELKAQKKAGIPHPLLNGKTLALIFEKPSLRTRLTFQVGMYQLGGTTQLIDTRLGERESVADVARNLERWVDGIMARTFAHKHVIELAEKASIPVINALTDKLHPCQILADVQTLREHKGKDLSSLKVAFVGDGNNVFHSWANFVSRLPLNLTLVCPEGYEGDPEIIERVRKETRAEFVITQDPEAGLKDADAVYTDVWASMGQEDEAAERAKIFAPYQVNSTLMGWAKKDALFMHCLPAHRGAEVTSEIIDGPNSVCFDQAENRLHAQKAVLATLMGGVS
ncbi:MAG TPA: ornithine carbamoyltransferase [Candidatus Hydrogenedentes bacterium]|jgi:ornithine carbamoyltransferase|nr:MAG: Ornithine carbamoyltransferase [Candidatus Hydrogenedentes bacterium ADurb.Bin170]HNZ48539.1 ornithine carbamoyltransferase [Candidatus Hydrogenedentota bacterium]HOH43687.1 ornithine carbamoyltransferase [Candidatus Hydrogenedentota bacterium]HOM49517.1 ornithine carbamoyltransferase [Candidatus Hydrogenedentota bacterium]HPK25675.1 ornithine carbamoyltransferase [Candidatus Hydrogenedentota bacterium]